MERDKNKRPAAVVLLLKGPLVLGLTCRHRISDLQLPGGGEEDDDGRGNSLAPYHTARRELHEETGINVSTHMLESLVDYVAHNGRFVRAFHAVPEPGREWPETFQPTEAGWPGWVHPQALLTGWCTYREEAITVLNAYRVKRGLDSIDLW